MYVSVLHIHFHASIDYVHVDAFNLLFGKDHPPLNPAAHVDGQYDIIPDRCCFSSSRTFAFHFNSLVWSHREPL